MILKYKLPFEIKQKLKNYRYSYIPKPENIRLIMLIQCVYFSQNRTVYIKGYNEAFTQVLIRELNKICEYLELPNNNIKALSNIITGYNFKNCFVFLDYYYLIDDDREYLKKEIRIRNPLNYEMY